MDSVRAEEPTTEAPARAIVVAEIAASGRRAEDVPALRITDASTLRRLESFFPGYRAPRSAELRRLWKAGYYVYFDFQDGSTIRVTVSRKPDAAFWSVGEADFDTKGDFEAFLEELRNRPE